MKKDQFLLGAALALIAPLLAFLTLSSGMFTWVEHKPSILYVVALLVNLFIARIYYGRGLGKTAQGVIFVTFIIVIFVVSLGQLSMGTDSY